jgi:hypothetical protein
MVFSDIQRDNTVSWKLRGIVSNSKADDNNNQICDIGHFMIFTDIAPYLNWIKLRVI